MPACQLLPWAKRILKERNKKKKQKEIEGKTNSPREERKKNKERQKRKERQIHRVK